MSDRFSPQVMLIGDETNRTKTGDVTPCFDHYTNVFFISSVQLNYDELINENV